MKNFLYFHEHLDLFFRPLFYQQPEKIYNLEKALQLQKPVRKKEVEEQEKWKMYFVFNSLYGRS